MKDKFPRFETETATVTRRTGNRVELALRDGLRMLWLADAPRGARVEVLLRACVPQAVRELPPRRRR